MHLYGSGLCACIAAGRAVRMLFYTIEVKAYTRISKGKVNARYE
jgi:hypothetical protein